MNITDAIQDRNLFKPWFKDFATWQAWIAFLRALFGLSMVQTSMQQIYQACTQRQTVSREPFNEAWLIVGRRGGKSFIAALIAVFIACFHDFRKYLSPGERGVVMLIAQNRKQARVLMRYVMGLLRNVPMLREMIQNETSECVTLSNLIDIEVHSASFRSTRGYTIVAAICDETAFWRSEDSANPDREILDSIRPGMATIPNALLCYLSQVRMHAVVSCIARGAHITARMTLRYWSGRPIRVR